VARANEQVQVERPVLAVLERSESVEDERLGWLGLRAVRFVEQLAVSAEPLEVSLDGARADAELSTDLAQA
jgi:hypothetical protein